MATFLRATSRSPRFISSILSSSIFLSFFQNAHAAVDVSGSFSGSLSSSVTTCASGYSSSSKTDSTTLTLTQSGTTYSGSGTVGSGSIKNISGSISATGSITGSSFVSYNSAGTATGNASYSGSLNGDSLTVSGTWTDIGYPSTGCTGSFSGSFSRGSASIISAASPSSNATAPILLSSQVNAITTAISARIGDAIRGVATGPRKIASGLMWESQSGLNAGDGTNGYGMWGSYSYSDFKNDLSSTALKGNRHNFMAGFDTTPWENSVLGLAIGYDRSDVDTTFNQGNQVSNGRTLSAYAGYVLNKTWSIDASMGYSKVGNSQFRTDTATSSRVNSSPTGNRYFGNANLNAVTQKENWLMGFRTGLLYARNITNEFSESNGTAISQATTKLGQFNIGGDLSYTGGKAEPFVRLIYENDYSMQKIQVSTGPQPSNDADSFLLGAGLRFFGSKGVSGNIELNKRIGRTNYNENTLAATFRMDF